MRKSWPILLPLTLLAAPAAGNAACFEEAAARYRLPSALLKAISRVESSGLAGAINRNADGSHDIGHMQINSAWLPTLARYGIDQKQLAEACTNTHVAAWILAQNIARLGYNWEAIGAYNATSPGKRQIYIHKILTALRREGGAVSLSGWMAVLSLLKGVSPEQILRLGGKHRGNPLDHRQGATVFDVR